MYIDAALINDKVFVSERNKDGIRTVKSHQPPWVFYHEDKYGTYTSIFGDKLKRQRFNNKKAWRRGLEEKKQLGLQIFESDIPPVYRLLEEKYPTDDAPDLHISLIDIEADKDPAKGWPMPSYPYGEITAVTIHNKWEDCCYTLMVPPPGLTVEELKIQFNNESHEDGFGSLSEEIGYIICNDEAELLLLFLELIEDADVLSGWNTEWYDLPYIIARIRIVLGEEDLDTISGEDGSPDFPYAPSEESIPYLQKLNLFPCLPSMRMVERFGKPEKTYTLYGRVHLDYMALYMKFTFEQLHSYSLDFVLNKEVGQTKVHYDGTLEELYRKHPRTYAAYNRQDVLGLSALDDKAKMIALANDMAHMAGVTLDKVTGSVVIIEQALLRRLHQNGLICFDKKEHDEGNTIPGAYVVEPTGGMFEWVVSYDFNSLYPTVIRLLNISPEVIIGQFKLDKTEHKFFKLVQEYAGGSTNQKRLQESASKAWTHFTGVLEYHDIIEEKENLIALKLENQDDEIALPANEWKQLLKENNWSISANGTVFDNNRLGLIPECLGIWYNERVEFKKKAKEMNKLRNSTDDPIKKKEYKDLEEYYDRVQTLKKLFLNSTYGAFLNRFFRFYDPRLGSSVTLSGRILTKTMLHQLNRLLRRAISGNKNERQ